MILLEISGVRGMGGGGAEAIPGNDEGTKNDIFAPHISQSVFNAV